MYEATSVPPIKATEPPAPYRVFAVEPEKRRRTRMTIELAGIAPSPVNGIDDVIAHLDVDDPTVVLLGPSFATDEGIDEALRVARMSAQVGVILLTDDVTMPLLQNALRAGLRDVVAINAGETQIRQAIERVGSAMCAIANKVAASIVPATRGRVLVSFSTKGGVGKSVVSTNLAVALAQTHRDRVVLVDADLQFGDSAVMLDVLPTHTTLQAAGAVDTADAQLMDGLLVTHSPSSLRVLCAPTEPSGSDSITPAAMVSIVRLLRTMFDFVIVDMPPHFDDVVIALLEEADEVLLVASMDIPSIKNLKVGIQTLDLLAIAGAKLRLVLNRANSKVHLDISDVERALGVTAEHQIPSDIAVPQAVNRGIPIVVDRPRSPAAQALTALAERVSIAGETVEAEIQQPNRRRLWRRSA